MIRTTPDSIRNSGTADPCSSPDPARLPIQFFLIVPVVHDSSAAVVHLVADLDNPFWSVAIPCHRCRGASASQLLCFVQM